MDTVVKPRYNTGKILTLLFLTFFSLTSYAKPKIVVSITPIASIVSILVKDKADIESLAVNNDCPHHHNIKPSDLAKVKNADIAIYINEQFDSFAEKLIDNHSKNIIKISNIKSLTTIKDNWHIWLDLNNTAILLQEFARIFSKNFPELQEDINNNLSAALKELSKLQEIRNNEFATIKDVVLLSDSSEYFFLNTNIKTAKLYSKSQKSLRYISKLEDLIKESNNKCLILSNEQNSRLYDKLNAKIIILNSENWNVQNIHSNTFQNQYLQMINQVKKCIR
ncbi:zinc/manganese ABC transporter substrate binding protein [Rickettsia akari str. Hartford]|uniref:Zinc/manganese ABC transporter substrate binding protein n=1 Tax=Rickettsia akari (strain Hartford) TaxID=293614 RepID=A8GLW8_RICAH|nr:metal ABC transporter substrate-binding protein [Rickettsia akari]ABV74393.1 zinc/manganese ABC transporter substrate binding protein [Rickettsia akari str. Hartford]